MLAQTNGDLVEVVGSGLASGVPIPNALADVPWNRLRFKGGQIIDAATQTTFYLDLDGTKHVVNGAGRKVVECSFNDGLIRDGDSWRVATADDALAGLKIRLSAEIDAHAERERLKYITPGSGQAAVYLAKAEEAAAFIAAGSDQSEADFLLLAAEVGVTADTLEGVARTILAQKAAWMALAAGIERARLQAKAAVAAAGDSKEAQAAHDAVAWPNSGGA